jgi:transcriptional antiterminator RfaH
VTGMAELQTYTVNDEYKWYAIYSRFHHEKAVELSLREKGIEVYLPKRKVLRTWSDRKKWIEEPLIRPYVFVKISSKEYYKVLQTPSVLNYLFFGGQAAPIPELQINLLKKITQDNLNFDITIDSFKPSENIKIIAGPLKGFEGKIVTHNGKTRFKVSICHLNLSLIVDIDIENINHN